MAGSSKRLETLDVLRGMAVYFIFTANVYFFSGMYFFDDATLQQFPTYPLDQVLDALVTILVEAKFYTVFSLLFGIGFYIQMSKFSETPGRFARYMFCRLSVLLLIGLVHLVFIWAGDILTLYALLGMMLLLFRNLSDRSLITWAIVLLLMPIVHALLMGVIGFYPGLIFQQFGAMTTAIAGQDPTPGTPLMFLRTEDVSLYFQLKVIDPMIRLAVLLADARFFKVMGIFILGLVIGRHIVHHRLLENTRLLKRTLIIGLLVGLPANVVIYLFHNAQAPMDMLIKTIAVAVGVVPLSLAYAAGVALLMRKQDCWLTVFAPVGRMALTNYVAQSVIMVFIFSGIGLGLIDDFGLSVALLIITLIFIMQIIASHLWLQSVRQGPLEYLWRRSVPTRLHASAQAG